MRIKRIAEDFRVDEVTSVPLSVDGPFGFYSLRKIGLTTFDALAKVRRRWKLTPNRVACGGLKDRHADTTQHFTVWHGPDRSMKEQGLEVRPLGRVREPFQSKHIDANRFRIVVRDARHAEAEAGLAALDEVRLVGVPNYFDDQRFGSARPGRQFFAKYLIEGQAEEALREAWTCPYEFDNAQKKNEKKLLRSHWGDWEKLRGRLPRGETRQLVEALASRPDDFAGAIRRWNPELRVLYLSAYQSHLWNRMLGRMLRTHLSESDRFEVPLRLGSVPMHRRLPATGLDLTTVLPLHHHQVRWPDDDPVRPAFERILEEEGLSQERFRVQGFGNLFFSKGERSAFCMPRGIEARVEADEIYTGRSKLTLSFELPRGAYATLIVKRMAGGGVEEG